MGLPLIDRINITQVAGATGSTGCSTPVLDMEGYEGCLFIAYEETTNTSNQLVVRGGTASNSLSEYAGPSGGEASGLQTNLYLDIFRPKKRYLDGYFNSSLGATGNCHIIAIRYGAQALPTTNDTATWWGRALSTPNTGTATASG